MAKLKKLSVTFLSLVATPATGKTLTLKSAGPNDRVQQFTIAKTDDDRMMAYGIVYAPDQVDSHGDHADADTIRRAAYEFMREARLKNIDTEHNFTPEMAFVAESWIVRSGDALFPDEPQGAWAVGIQIGDPDLWAELKSGDLTGISLAGLAQVEPDPKTPKTTEKNGDMPGWFQNFIKTMTGKKDESMEKQEVESMIAEAMEKSIGPAVQAALKSALVPEQEPEPAAPDTAALAEAVAKALQPTLADQVAKAVAKGVQEADPSEIKYEESFA